MWLRASEFQQHLKHPTPVQIGHTLWIEAPSRPLRSYIECFGNDLGIFPTLCKKVPWGPGVFYRLLMPPDRNWGKGVVLHPSVYVQGPGGEGWLGRSHPVLSSRVRQSS